VGVYAHFGNYTAPMPIGFADPLLLISSAVLVPALCGDPGLVWLGALDANHRVATAVLLACFTLHFAALEIGRCHLHRRRSNRRYFVRSVLALHWVLSR